MTTQDYVIRECLDDKFKEYFIILKIKSNDYVLVGSERFDTLEEAKEAVRLIRKHRQPIYHYVED